MHGVLFWPLNVSTQGLLIEIIIPVISSCMKAEFALHFLVKGSARLFSSSKDAVCVIGREGHLDNGSVKV